MKDLPMTERPDLAALLGSRICHDLISPIGAIGNGVELLMMDGSAKGPEMALISESVANANARIRYFRVAFGASGGDQRIARAEVQGILADLTRGSRLQIDWKSPVELPRREVKLVFLLIQCLETAMAYGGRISIERNDTGRWLILGTHGKLKVDPALWEVLSNPAASVEIGPAQVQFALAPDEVRALKRSLTVGIKDSEIRLAF